MQLPLISRRSSARPTSAGLLWLSVACLVAGPLPSCGKGEDENDEDSGSSAKAWVSSSWSATRDASTGAWGYVAGRTSDALVVVGSGASSGAEAVDGAARASWLWSKDRSANGWQWIVEQASDAGEWSADATGKAWRVTRSNADRFSLWVQVETDEAVSWTKTTLPEAWRVTKEAGGETFVWIGDHKLEMGLVSLVVATVVIGLLTGPEFAVAGVAERIASGLGVRLLSNLYEQNKATLVGVGEDVFRSIGSAVLAESGKSILSSRTTMD